MFVNCMTAALKIENENISPLDLNLWYSRNPENEIREKCERLNRSCRRLENEGSPLEEEEWLIAFFGFIPLHRDYEGRVDQYDYHFIFHDGNKWLHRPSKGKEICTVSDNLIADFTNAGFPPQFFAIKRV